MKTNKKELELVRSILSQAIEISSNTNIDVFVNYSGHVDYLSIAVHLQGWNIENKADYRNEIWFSIDNEDHCKKQLIEVLKYFKVIQEKHKLN